MILGTNIVQQSSVPPSHRKMNKAKLPTHIEIDAKKCRLVKNSVVLLEQIRTIDKQRLREQVCHLDQELMKKVNEALKISLELHT